MTEAINMVRTDVSTKDLHRWMSTRRLNSQEHAFHCLLVETFGKELAPKPFRTMFPKNGDIATLYGYTEHQAEELREAAALFACPLQASIIPAQSIECKPMPTEWRTGKRLGFEVRVRPTVRLDRNPARVATEARHAAHTSHLQAGSECDAFTWQIAQYPKGEMPHSRERIYCRWLEKQLEDCGVALDTSSVTLASFRLTKSVRQRNGRNSTGPDAVLRGTLTVQDAEAFNQLLARGVGRHRAYGYGMLLLKPNR